MVFLFNNRFVIMYLDYHLGEAIIFKIERNSIGLFKLCPCGVNSGICLVGKG